MAEILLNFFDNIILAAAVEEVVPAVGFFKETLWTRTQKGRPRNGLLTTNKG